MGTLVSPTLQSEISTIRAFLNQRDSSNSMWTDQELLSYLNEAIRMYFLEVVQNNEGYFTTTTMLSITANVETVPLPSDFFSVKGLYFQQNSTDYILLQYQNNVTENYSVTGVMGSTAYQPYYYFRGNELVLRPIPAFSQANGLNLEYIQFPATVIDGGDSVTAGISPVFKQVIEAYAIWKAKMKQALVNGTSAIVQVAKENLDYQVVLFRDAVKQRSRRPTTIRPFTP